MQSRLKKPGLDPADIANFRPVSNLTFTSKVVERAAAGQLNAYFAPMDYYLGINRPIESDIRPKPPCCASGLMF